MATPPADVFAQADMSARAAQVDMSARAAHADVAAQAAQADVAAQAARPEKPDAEADAASPRKRKSGGDAVNPPPDKRPGGAARAGTLSEGTSSGEHGTGSAVGPCLRNRCSETRGEHPTVAMSDVHRIVCAKEITTKIPRNGRLVTVKEAVLVCTCTAPGPGGATYEAWLALPRVDKMHVLSFLGDVSYDNGGDIGSDDELDGGKGGERGQHGPACCRAGPDGREGIDDRGPLDANSVAKAGPVASRFVMRAAAMCDESVEEFLARLRTVLVRVDGLVHHQGVDLPAVVLILFPLYAHLDLRTVLAIIPHVVTYWEEDHSLEESHLQCMYAFAVVLTLTLMMKDAARLQAAVEQADQVGECRPFNQPRAVLAVLASTGISNADLAARAVGFATRASGYS